MRPRCAVVAALSLAFILCGFGSARAGGIATQRISGAHLTALAQRVVRSISLPADSSLVPAFSVPSQTLPSGKASVVVGRILRNPSYVNVPIVLAVNGHYQRTIFVGYRILRWVKTAVAARDLIEGSVLSARDLTMKRVVFQGQRVNGIHALLGRRLEGTFRRGQPVYLEETQTNQIVKAGATITMIVDDGGVSVVADVLARTSGGLGDQVSVYNPQTNTALSGTVVGPDRVELDLGGTH